MTKRKLFATLALSTLFFLPLQAHQPAAANGEVFERLTGSWRGKGFVRTSPEEDSESIRCKMKNTNGGNRLDLSGNCAVSGFVFSLRGYIEQNGSRNSYRASMFQALANLKQETFSGKRSGKNLNFVFKAYDRLSKSNVEATIAVVTRNDRFEVRLRRTDPKTKKRFDVGTISFTKR